MLVHAHFLPLYFVFADDGRERRCSRVYAGFSLRAQADDARDLPASVADELLSWTGC
jgi:hypothetical protein